MRSTTEGRGNSMRVGGNSIPQKERQLYVQYHRGRGNSMYYTTEGEVTLCIIPQRERLLYVLYHRGRDNSMYYTTKGKVTLYHRGGGNSIYYTLQALIMIVCSLSEVRLQFLRDSLCTWLHCRLKGVRSGDGMRPLLNRYFVQRCIIYTEVTVRHIHICDVGRCRKTFLNCINATWAICVQRQRNIKTNKYKYRQKI